MRILLVNPRTREYMEGVTVQAEAPLGILNLAAVLREDGHNIKILDRNIEGNRIQEYIKFAPELIGFSSFTGPLITDALRLSKLFQDYIDAPIIWGGIHASLLPIQTIQNPYIDGVVVGEGEETIVELADYMEKGRDLSEVRGLVWKKANNGSIKIIENEPRCFIQDLDKLPFPAWDLVDEKKYLKTSTGLDRSSSAFFSIQSSRGCPYNCGFCYNTAFNKRKWRAKSPERVLEEILFLKNKYNIKKLNFKDDNFIVNKKRTQNICKGLIKNKLDITFNADCRVDLYSREVGMFLKAGGCDQIYFGVESGSPRILKLINKGITVDQAVDAIKVSKKLKIPSTTSFMIGIPTEDLHDMLQTEQLIYKLSPDNLLLKIFTPYPGTNLYDYLIKKNLFQPPSKLEDWAIRWTKISQQLSEVSNTLLRQQINRILMKYYFKKIPFLMHSLIKNILTNKISIPRLLYWGINQIRSRFFL